jgi:hypothetical protein
LTASIRGVVAFGIPPKVVVRSDVDVVILGAGCAATLETNSRINAIRMGTFMT